MDKYRPVLITGGAGYIGSHAVLAFLEAGYPVVVLDDLSTGHRDAVAGTAVFVEGDAGDPHLVSDLIARHGITAVIHFAGSVVVPESVADPLKYYRNNTCVSRTLIETCIAHGVNRFIFSSTAAVYGMPTVVPVAEDAPTVPINPYGTSKLMTEWMLRDAAAAHDLRYVALRYFNVAGADPQARTGQRAEIATHLIEVATRAALGLLDGMQIFGDDYDTPDGTCIRDYIHVSDLAEAHVLALRHLESGGETAVLNLGNERGFSVREVVETVQRLSGRTFSVTMAPRRAGDPACLVAATARARETLGWRPQRAGLETQIADALRWHRARTAGMQTP
ncbi:MAG: UDP-glucose 4-epimerase GalE [Alphaproteobacteria bacterium]|nr:MAG: UDP-glucose 4-epimerase GalE [Alphaproteobacteria bacterium]